MTRCGRRAGHRIVSLPTALQFLLSGSIDTRAEEEEADCCTAVCRVWLNVGTCYCQDSFVFLLLSCLSVRTLGVHHIFG